MAVLWAGRFSKQVNETVNAFNASIEFDSRFYAEDIEGSLAHSAMLAKQGIITEEEKEEIHTGLKNIKKQIENGEVVFSHENYEDIHTCIEQLLTEQIGQAGKKLHTGRSRNDQVALDLRLYVRKQIVEIKEEALHLIEVLVNIALANTETIMPGYTHLQRAQPITFAHNMMAYANMLKRDVKRLDNTLEMMDEMPLGSGALAATTYPLDREFVAEQLGFSRITENSLDGVSDRDYCVELLSDISIIMMHLSRLSEEIILWCSWEFKFIELDDAFSTGSSIMPQKKNPDICELVRGKTGRVYGDLMGMLTTLKGIPLAYNKDMQEDKEGVFDAIDTVKQCLTVIAPMLETMTVKKENMAKAGEKGFINATDCADYLTKKGMAFRDAYKLTGGMVSDCIAKDKTLSQLTMEELKAYSDLFDTDFYEAIDLLNAVNKRDIPGGPSASQVKKQCESMKHFLEVEKNA